MGSHSELFPWPSYYGHYDFFEGRLNNHAKVASLTAKGNGIYELTRTMGDTLRVFICECYAFGVAEYLETAERLGNIDVVIINSAWCGYSLDAKLYCRNVNVGLFKIGEFMSALYLNDHWLHLTEEQKEYFLK